MSLEAGKTYLVKPAMVNGVWTDDRTFRVDEVVQDGMGVRGALNGVDGWTYIADALIPEPLKANPSCTNLVRDRTSTHMTDPRTLLHPDSIATDRFALVMKEKLAASRAKGRDGWRQCSLENLWQMLREHVERAC